MRRPCARGLDWTCRSAGAGVNGAATSSELVFRRPPRGHHCEDTSIFGVVALARTLLARGLAVAAAGALTILALGAPPAAADPEVGPVVARFDFNEARGSTTFTDTVGGLVGRIGSDVVTDGTRHKYATRLPFSGAFPGHTDVVSGSRKLHSLINPGEGSFSFTIRYKTAHTFGANIMQKGQSGAAGGFWKMEIYDRSPMCVFRGGDGATRTANVRRHARLSRGWHTITCVRTPTYVQMWVDGVAQPARRGPTGTIHNTQDFSVGGKSFCDDVRITCDYFAGSIDYIEFRKG